MSKLEPGHRADVAPSRRPPARLADVEAAVDAALAGKALTGEQIAGHLQRYSRAAVARALNHLVARGEVRRRAGDVYARAADLQELELAPLLDEPPFDRLEALLQAGVISAALALKSYRERNR